jgi:hypothetical protein
MQSPDERADSSCFISQFVDGSLWVGVEFRALLNGALNRLTLPVLEQLVNQPPVFFAPDSNLLGRTEPARIPLDIQQFIVYRSPEPLPKSQGRAEFVIAHEPAHVILSYQDKPWGNARLESAKDEIVVGNLVESRGF